MARMVKISCPHYTSDPITEEEALDILTVMEEDGNSPEYRVRSFVCTFERHDLIDVESGKVIVTFDPITPY